MKKINLSSGINKSEEERTKDNDKEQEEEEHEDESDINHGASTLEL